MTKLFTRNRFLDAPARAEAKTGVSFVTDTIRIVGELRCMAVAPKGRLVYMGVFDPNVPAGTVYVRDATTNAEVATIPVGTYQPGEVVAPAFMAVAPNGGHVYVASYESNAMVSVIDTTINAEIARIPVEAEPNNMAVTPDGRHVYVTHYLSNAVVSVIDTAINAVVAKIQVASYPAGIAITPDGRHVYVSTIKSNVVSVIDIITNSVVATIPVGTKPIDMEVAPDGGHIYVANSESNTVSVIDTAINTEVAKILAGTKPQGMALALSPIRNHIYVTSFLDGMVSVIDIIGNAVVARIPDNTGQIDVIVSPDGGNAYVNSLDNIVSIDTFNNTVIGQIPISDSPVIMAATAEYIYAAKYRSNTVSAFRLGPNRPALYLLLNRSKEWRTPSAAGAPTACVVPGIGVNNIIYRDTSGHLHELWRDAAGNTGTTDLTANAGAPTAVSNPFIYVDTIRNMEILLFRSGDGTVRSLYWTTGHVGHDNLSGYAKAPKAGGDPVGYYVAAADTHHVIYRSGDGNLHELYWTGVAPVVYGGNLTGAISAPRAAGDPTVFANTAGFNFVIYRGVNGHILSLYWKDGPSGLDNLSGYAGTPLAAGDPFAYYTAHNDTYQVIYRSSDGHLWELYWHGVAPVAGWDLTANSGAPAASGNPVAYYSAGTNTKHVIYRSADGRLHEIWWVPGAGKPAWFNPDDIPPTNKPRAADRPAAFVVEGSNSQHVMYRGTDNQIYEVIWHLVRSTPLLRGVGHPQPNMPSDANTKK